MAHLIRYLTIAAFGITACWVGSKPDEIKPYIGLLTTLAAIIANDAKHFRDLSRKKLDRKLFGDFLKCLPSNGSVGFFHDHEMSTGFPGTATDQLDEFIKIWCDAEHEFLDPVVERSKKILFDLIDQFTASLAQYTFPSRSVSDYQQVQPDWRNTQPGFYSIAVAELRRFAIETYSAHQDFVRLCRRRLGTEDVS